MHKRLFAGCAVPLLLASALAQAEATVSVASNSMLRLPNTTSTLLLDRLDIADSATLVVPATVTEIRVGELRMGRDAHLSIVPSPEPFRLEARHGELATGAYINARGASGSFDKPATPGRNLSLRLEQVQVGELTIDVRGGIGRPGYQGLDGADGKAPGCTWGQAEPGYDGQNGGDGQTGAPGGQVRLEVPNTVAENLLTVKVDGGLGGAGGEAGKGGQGGAAKGCLVYRADGAKAGKPGLPGQPGGNGSAGSFNLVRIQ
ncbi:MAG: collagen-like protein [Pseudomonas sp.]